MWRQSTGFGLHTHTHTDTKKKKKMDDLERVDLGSRRTVQRPVDGEEVGAQSGDADGRHRRPVAVCSVADGPVAVPPSPSSNSEEEKKRLPSVRCVWGPVRVGLVGRRNGTEVVDLRDTKSRSE